MNIFFQKIYAREITTQCQFAKIAVHALNNALHQTQNSSLEINARQIFFEAEIFRQIHSFLTHASNVSRLFWPPVPQKRATESEVDYQNRIGNIDKVQRAICLRNLYHLQADNCLSQRTLRDHLEHYDERLDHWRLTSEHHNFVKDTIGPANTIVGAAQTDTMRWFDPTNNTFRFRGEVFNLQELANEIVRILNSSQQIEINLQDQ